MVQMVSDYASPIVKELSSLGEREQSELFESISTLIYQLNQKNIIQVQRTCFNCQFYQGNKTSTHYCKLLEKELKKHEIRLDCNEFEGNE